MVKDSIEWPIQLRDFPVVVKVLVGIMCVVLFFIGAFLIIIGYRFNRFSGAVVSVILETPSIFLICFYLKTWIGLPIAILLAAFLGVCCIFCTSRLIRYHSLTQGFVSGSASFLVLFTLALKYKIYGELPIIAVFSLLVFLLFVLCGVYGAQFGTKVAIWSTSVVGGFCLTMGVQIIRRLSSDLPVLSLSLFVVWACLSLAGGLLQRTLVAFCDTSDAKDDDCCFNCYLTLTSLTLPSWFIIRSESSSSNNCKIVSSV